MPLHDRESCYCVSHGCAGQVRWRSTIWRHRKRDQTFAAERGRVEKVEDDLDGAPIWGEHGGDDAHEFKADPAELEQSPVLTPHSTCRTFPLQCCHAYSRTYHHPISAGTVMIRHVNPLLVCISRLTAASMMMTTRSSNKRSPQPNSAFSHTPVPDTCIGVCHTSTRTQEAS